VPFCRGAWSNTAELKNQNQNLGPDSVFLQRYVRPFLVVLIEEPKTVSKSESIIKVNKYMKAEELINGRENNAKRFFEVRAVRRQAVTA